MENHANHSAFSSSGWNTGRPTGSLKLNCTRGKGREDIYLTNVGQDSSWNPGAGVDSFTKLVW